MFEMIAGLVLMFTPFVLVCLFEDWRQGVLSVGAGALAFHSAVGLLTQAFGVFDYPVVLTLHIVAALTALGWFVWKRKSVRLGALGGAWAVVLCLVTVAIIFFQLYSVHYRYTGVVATVSGPVEVSDDNYPYPLFSDEWVAVSLASYSIKSGSLPVVNPLWENRPSANLLAPFHSLVAELLLLTGLDPLTGFPALAIVSGVLVCLSAMLLVASLGGGLFASLAAGLAVPFITNGSNLPGIWFLLPYTVSLVALLWLLSAISLDRFRLSVACAFLSVFFYPPAVVFVVPAMVAYLYSRHSKPRPWKVLWLAVAVAGVFLIAIASVTFGEGEFLAKVSSALFHPNLDGGIASYPLWIVAPLIFVPFSIVGAVGLFRRRQNHVLVVLVTGFTLWFIYSLYPGVIIIEYPRVVAISSVILACVSALGAGIVADKVFGRKGLLWSSIVLVSVCGALSLSYPSDDSWRKLTLSVPVNGGDVTVSPAAPVNRYLHPDDLRLFAGITEERFVAPAWKGLVIGVATGNYPLETKPSTLTNRILPYGEFVMADCGTKASLALDYKVSHVYTEAFSCEKFEIVGTSGEGLSLYSFVSE